MSANPYDQLFTCTCSAWSSGECACGGYVDRGQVRAWDEGYRAGRAAAPDALRERVEAELHHAEGNEHHLCCRHSQGVRPGEVVPAVRIEYIRAALAGPTE